MITYELIYDAANGDIIALDSLIKQYQNYINTLSKKKIIHNGKIEYIVDVDLKDQLISKMIDLTLNFNPFPKYYEDI